MRIQIQNVEMEEYITLPVAVTPSNKCDDIDSVETDDTMFVKPISINCGRSAWKYCRCLAVASSGHFKYIL